ncbi:hypothetical protein ABTJ79_20575, partial [Acinetobacter baumannii]
AKIQDLTINGQKIEDLATSNVAAAQGVKTATVGIQTTGKPVLLIAARGYRKWMGVSIPLENGERYVLSWYTPTYMWIEQPGAGWHTYTVA